MHPLYSQNYQHACAIPQDSILIKRYESRSGNNRVVLVHEVRKWLNDLGPNTHHVDEECRFVVFKDPETATLFKLTWA
jgi:hypothetical protein